MPRRPAALMIFGAMPPGAEPQLLRATLTEGHSRFLTSGGEAVATVAYLRWTSSGATELLPFNTRS
jgi:hypothetical protein